MNSADHLTMAALRTRIKCAFRIYLDSGWRMVEILNLHFRKSI